jgi:hypothetical protein
VLLEFPDCLELVRRELEFREALDCGDVRVLALTDPADRVRVEAAEPFRIEPEVDDCARRDVAEVERG